MAVQLPDVGLQPDELAGRGGPVAAGKALRHQDADHVGVPDGLSVGAERPRKLHGVPAGQRELALRQQTAHAVLHGRQGNRLVPVPHPDQHLPVVALRHALNQQRAGKVVVLPGQDAAVMRELPVFEKKHTLSLLTTIMGRFCERVF